MKCPNDLTVLIHYHVSPEIHPRHDAPAVQESINEYTIDGILERDENGCHRTTEKGRAYVKLLCSIPYPEMEYVNPLTKEIINEY